jgi:hypothetical protein
MTTQSISFIFNGSQKEIPIGLVPLVDEPMQALLGELLKASPPPPSVKALSERIKDLTEMEELLNLAKKKVSRDKVIGIPPAVVLAALVAAIALGFLFHPVVGVVLLVLTLAYLIVCHTIATWLGRKNKKQEFDRPLAMYPLAVLASPFILSHLLLTRSSSLRCKAERAKKEVQSHASETFCYWSKNGATLAERLQRLETRLKQSLVAVKKQPVRSPQGEKDLADYKVLLDRTRVEIQKALQMAKV